MVNDIKKAKSGMYPQNTQEMEEECIALAMEEARRRLQEGTASPAIITHFLKRASNETRIKEEMLAAQTALLEEKKRNMELSQREMEVYEEAIEAFRNYGGGRFGD